MKKISLILISLMMTACASYPQHWGSIPEDARHTYNKPSKPTDENLAEIICAEGEREYYFIGTSKPKLMLRFTDEGSSFFKSYRNAWKVAPKERNFNLHWSFKGSYADFSVRDFKFEPNEKYYAKYSANQNKIKVWIETQSGDVVFGKKPTEGQF
jgi:WD40 repeat protein